MPRVIHFEIPVDDPKRAVEFYEKALGWQIAKWDGPMDYWLVKAGDDAERGADGALTLRASTPHTVNTVSVPSVDEYSERVSKAGGKITMPKSPVPGVGYLAMCEDTEGNSFGILEMDPSAK